MLQVMTFSIGVIESDTVSTSNISPLIVAVRNFQNSESTSFLPGGFRPKAAQLEDGYDLFVQDGEVLPLLFNPDNL